MGWCDDPKDKYYNKLVKNHHKIKCEKLYRNDRKYDYLIHINHNTKKIVPFNGSAIFLHLTSNYKPTACLLYTSPSPRDGLLSRMPSSA